MTRPEELTTPLYSLGAKLFVVVCRSTSSAVTPTCISWSPTGRYSTLASLLRENLPLHYISPCTWGKQRGGREVSYSSYQASFLVPLQGTLMQSWSTLLVGYPKWKVDADSGKFPLAKMLRFEYRTSRTQEDTLGGKETMQ